MSNFSAMVHVDYAKQANSDLEELGFGPSNFSVPVSSPSATMGADWVGFHCWDMPDFRQAVADLDPAYGVIIEDAVTVTIDPGTGDEIRTPTGKPNLAEACEKHSLEWTPFDGKNENLPMKGDVRTFKGKDWESLIDYNPYEPPVAWRERAREGLPAWIQPTGSADAYPLNFEVTHKSKDWRSTTPANVWEPGVYGWTQINIPAGETPAVWTQQTYPMGARVTFNGKVYESVIANNSWSPVAYPAGWIVIP